MLENITKTQKIIIAVIVGVLLVTGMVGGGVAIANAAKAKEQARCEHVYDEGKIKSEATCEKPGIIVYTCKTCAYENTEEIPANGHIETQIAAIPATCKSKGMTDGIKCVTCDKVLVAPVETPLLGHVPKVVEGLSNTCTTVGKTQGSICTRCGETLKEQVILPAKGHNVQEIKGYPATCTAVGKTNGSKCSDCGKVFSEQEDIPLISHTGMEADAICDVCGYTDTEALFALYQVEGNYMECAARIGENIAYQVYRIYKTPSVMDTSNSGNRIYFTTIGIGAKEGYDEVGAILAWSTLEEAYFIYKDYGDYIDFYMKPGTYKMAAGPMNDLDGDGFIDVTISADTVITSMNGEDRCFRLELK